MERLTDDSPYKTLGLTPTADRNAVRSAFARKSAERISGDQRRIIHQAYETLRSPDERALVDALTPLLEGADPPEEIMADLDRLVESRLALVGLLDLEAIWRDDYHALLQATIRTLCLPDDATTVEMQLLSDYTDMDSFIADYAR